MESTFLHLFHVHCNLTGRNAVKTENEVFFIVFSVLSKPQIKKKIKSTRQACCDFSWNRPYYHGFCSGGNFLRNLPLPSPILDFAMFGR